MVKTLGKYWFEAGGAAVRSRGGSLWMRAGAGSCWSRTTRTIACSPAALLADAPGPPFDLEWVATTEEGLERIARGEFDVVLVDYHLGAASGLDLVREARRAATACR